MPYRYIITVGTSLMEVPCFQLQNEPLWDHLLGEDKRLSLTDREQVRMKMEKFLNECGDDPDSFITKYPFNSSLWEENKYHFLGAELATLRKVHITKQLIKPEDSIDLFATRKESASGQCGVFLKNILTGIFPECSITLDYTESLDISQPTTFSNGLKEIRTKVHTRLNDSVIDTPVWLILSGGYKIVAMMLAQLQTRPEFSKKVSVAALHEDSSEGILLLPQLDIDTGAKAQTEEGKTLSIPEPDISDF
jgi:hypothetical protein